MLLERPTKTHSDRPLFHFGGKHPLPPRSRTSRPGSGSHDDHVSGCMTSCYPLLPSELVGLAVACDEAEHVQCAGRIHLAASGPFGTSVAVKISPSHGLSFSAPVARSITSAWPSCLTVTLPTAGWGKLPSSGPNGGDGRGFAGLTKSSASFSAEAL